MNSSRKNLYSVTEIPEAKARPSGPSLVEKKYTLKGQDGRDIKELAAHFSVQGGWKYVKTD